MKMLYDVLWIDDQHGSMSKLHNTAKDYGIKLHPFKSMNGGCTALENNPYLFDAVLLDAKFFENENNKPGSEDTQWIHETKDRIRDLDKSLQYFVLTGQASTYASEEFNKAFKHVFEKGKDEDEDTLFELLVKACKNRELTKLKVKYPNPFSICHDNYLGSKEFERVLQIVKDIENPESIINQKDALSPMRKVLEAIFKKLNKIGFIPDEVQKGKGPINGSSKFLAGSNNEYRFHEELIHPVIAESIRYLTGFTQDATHNEGNRLDADTYFNNSKNTYLYQSVCYSMIEVLDYLKVFIDENSDIAKNQSKWEFINTPIISNGNWIFGSISRIAGNGYGTFEPDNGDQTLSILPSKMKDSLLTTGDKIKVTTLPSPCGTKTYINNIKKLIE